MNVNRIGITKKNMIKISKILVPKLHTALHFGANEYNFAAMPVEVAELIGRPNAAGRGFNAYYSADTVPQIHHILFV